MLLVSLLCPFRREQRENGQNHILGHFTIPKCPAWPCTGGVKFSSAFIIREHMKLGGYSRFLSTLSHREEHWSLLHGQCPPFAGEKGLVRSGVCVEGHTPVQGCAVFLTDHFESSLPLNEAMEMKIRVSRGTHRLKY